jgi:molecular chaperone HscA
VSAEEKTTGTRASVQVKPSYGLDDTTVEKMIIDSIENAEQDVDQRQLVEARVEADRILAALEKAIDADRKLLSEAEMEALRTGIVELRAAKDATSHRAIQDRISKLDQLSAEFAVRRMNESISRALEGKNARDMA